jgi:hypothetical protein
MTLKISELFISDPNKHFYKKQELYTLKLSSNFINKMEVLLNLSYLESTNSKSNLCFENNSDVQPAFRTIFTKMDIINYINVALNKDNFEIETDKIPLPSNAVNFWETVKNAK